MYNLKTENELRSQSDFLFYLVDIIGNEHKSPQIKQPLKYLNTFSSNLAVGV